MSPIALVGGNEFRRDCDPMDRALVALAGGPDTQLAILPTAATNENPFVAGESGVRHFRRLGARADKLMIVDEQSANQADLVGLLEDYAFIYFTGGDPVYLHDTLSASKAWEAVRAVHQRGGLIAGSSAGAMVLGGLFWRFDGWSAGLGLAPRLALLPHHATLAARWNAANMAASLPAGMTLVGIDDATALLIPEGRVVGIGQVTVYAAAGALVFGPGEAVPLPARLE